MSIRQKSISKFLPLYRWCQCDQMARCFVQYLAIQNNNKNAQWNKLFSKLRSPTTKYVCQILNKSIKFPNTFKISPKWQNFTKSGCTGWCPIFSEPFVIWSFWCDTDGFIHLQFGRFSFQTNWLTSYGSGAISVYQTDDKAHRDKVHSTCLTQKEDFIVWLELFGWVVVPTYLQHTNTVSLWPNRCQHEVTGQWICRYECNRLGFEAYSGLKVSY